MSVFQVAHLIRRKRLQLKLGDVREYYATFMTRFLDPAEIDFLQGHVSPSVFMRNYFNPAMIQELRERASVGIKAILTEIH